MTFEYLVEQIKKHRGRMTPQREIILRHLVDHQNELLTADRLLVLSQKENPQINMTTIYRNLEVLEEMNLIYKLNIDPTTSAFKLTCDANEHHHHIICKSCGKMIAINYCPMSPELLDKAKKSGFTITDHNLDLYGLCDSCIRRNNK